MSDELHEPLPCRADRLWRENEDMRQHEGRPGVTPVDRAEAFVAERSALGGWTVSPADVQTALAAEFAAVEAEAQEQIDRLEDQLVDADGIHQKLLADRDDLRWQLAEVQVNKPESDIDAFLRIARELRPDLHARTKAVARIIDPGAFADGWAVEPPEAARLHAMRLEVLRGNAMRKAQDVLQYLGVNTDADWFTILTRLAEEKGAGGE